MLLLKCHFLYFRQLAQQLLYQSYSPLMTWQHPSFSHCRPHC